MEVTLSAGMVITGAAFIGALITIAVYVAKVVRWFDEQKKQGTDIHDIRDTHNKDVADIKKEQALLVYGILACLKGLKEQGCNGPVTEAIDKIEKHLNVHAHE